MPKQRTVFTISFLQSFEPRFVFQTVVPPKILMFWSQSEKFFALWFSKVLFEPPFVNFLSEGASSIGLSDSLPRETGTTDSGTHER
jgi:hypothetical protein